MQLQPLCSATLQNYAWTSRRSSKSGHWCIAAFLRLGKAAQQLCLEIITYLSILSLCALNSVRQAAQNWIGKELCSFLSVELQWSYGFAYKKKSPQETILHNGPEFWWGSRPLQSRIEKHQPVILFPRIALSQDLKMGRLGESPSSPTPQFLCSTFSRTWVCPKKNPKPNLSWGTSSYCKVLYHSFTRKCVLTELSAWLARAQMFLFACPQTYGNYACHRDPQAWSFRPWRPFDKYDKYANLRLLFQVEPARSFWRSSSLDVNANSLDPQGGPPTQLWEQGSELLYWGKWQCVHGYVSSKDRHFSGVWTKKVILGKNWLGFARDLARGVCLFLFWRRQTMDYILCSVTPSMSVDFSQTVLSLLLQPSKCITFCWSRRFLSISVSCLNTLVHPPQISLETIKSSAQLSLADWMHHNAACYSAARDAKDIGPCH